MTIVDPQPQTSPSYFGINTAIWLMFTNQYESIIDTTCAAPVPCKNYFPNVSYDGRRTGGTAANFISCSHTRLCARQIKEQCGSSPNERQIKMIPVNKPWFGKGLSTNFNALKPTVRLTLQYSTTLCPERRTGSVHGWISIYTKKCEGIV